ncbi:hypothetical protein [Maritalea mediterranea]|uniref:Uncharacterized protein n=1 Tax=Maritalea mediterranea TaxID=2909667 RepID=A0ABS9EEC0_9HYPH|nr:hypothetical protein [Maritalea mediterranea]MCF4099796.1 hypothetical protein [Maritalea mediterranea]
MNKKNFATDILKELAWTSENETVTFDEGVFKVVVNEIVDTSRWSNIYDLVFEWQGSFYRTSYSVGATEMQDEQPFEYADAEVECFEVAPKVISKTIYEPIEA